MMARCVITAKAALDSGAGDQKFLNSKINTAQFYAVHILPQAQAYLRTVINGAESVLKAEF